MENCIGTEQEVDLNSGRLNDHVMGRCGDSNSASEDRSTYAL